MNSQNSNLESPFVTPAEAAEILRISITSVYRRIKDGTIKGCRIGHVFRISRTHLAEMQQGV